MATSSTQLNAAPYTVVPAGGGDPYVAMLTAAQSDGISCARCRTTGVPMMPDGRCYPPGSGVEVGGVQVFRCSGRCEVTR